jgi:hypothetical protein
MHTWPGVRVVERDRPGEVWQAAQLPVVAPEGTDAAAWGAAARAAGTAVPPERIAGHRITFRFGVVWHREAPTAANRVMRVAFTRELYPGISIQDAMNLTDEQARLGDEHHGFFIPNEALLQERNRQGLRLALEADEEPVDGTPGLDELDEPDELEVEEDRDL